MEEQFKENVRAWITMDDQIRKARAALREIKKQQAVLSASIKEFMSENNIDDLNTTQGKIRYEKKTVKARLTLNEVKEKISELASTEQSEVSVNALSEMLFAAERPVKEKVSLRRIVPRNTMSLAI